MALFRRATLAMDPRLTTPTMAPRASPGMASAPGFSVHSQLQRDQDLGRDLGQNRDGEIHGSVKVLNTTSFQPMLPDLLLTCFADRKTCQVEPPIRRILCTEARYILEQT